MNSSLSDAWLLFQPALVQTFQMAGIVLGLTVAIGVPLATYLFNVSPFGLFPNYSVYTTLSWIVSVGRSIPFLILMAAIIPLSRLIAGTSLGLKGAILPLTLGALPMFVRLVESALRSVPPEISEVAQVSGATRLKTIVLVQLPEAVPLIITSLTIAVIAIFDITTVAGVVGGGGIGYLAISHGYNRFDNTIMVMTVAALVVITVVVQLTGDTLAKWTQHSE